MIFHSVKSDSSTPLVVFL